MTILSELENLCLDWVSNGKSDYQIGLELSLSEHAVHLIVQSAVAKLEAQSRAHAVGEAIRSGIIN